MAEWKEGDLVRLKSGGPTMTLCYKTAMGGQYQCQWFVGTKLESGLFEGAVLMKVETETE